MNRNFFCVLLFLSFGALLFADSHKEGKKAYLGIDLEDNPLGQMVVVKVLADSPAEKSGMKKGDILVGINGKKCQKLEDVVQILGKTSSGEKATFHMMREGKLTVVEVVLGESPAKSKKKNKKKNKKKKGRNADLGIYTPIHLSVKNATLEDVLNRIFEKSHGRVQYIALSDTVLRHRVSMTVRNLGAIYAAQYACVVSNVAFRAVEGNQGRLLFIIYPSWNETKSPKKEKKQSKKASKAVATHHVESAAKESPYLGLDIAAALTEAEAKQFPQPGTLVLDVLRFSPAEAAGIRKGDLVVAVGDEATPSSEAFLKILAGAKVGDSLVFKIYRGKKRGMIKATLAKDPRFHGLLHKEMHLEYDSALLGNILSNINKITKGRMQFASSSEALLRNRFSMRVRGIHLQMLFSYILKLSNWEYQLIQSGYNEHLLLITREKSKK